MTDELQTAKTALEAEAKSFLGQYRDVAIAFVAGIVFAAIVFALVKTL